MQTPHSLSLILISVLGFLSSVSSAPASDSVVTIYDVKPSKSLEPAPAVSIERSGTTVYSAITAGVTASDVLKYEVQDIRSRLVVHVDGREPVTVIGEPTTVRKYTIEQGPSTLKQNYPPIYLFVTPTPGGGGGGYMEPGLSAECTLDKENQIAACVGERLVPQPMITPGPTVVSSPEPTRFEAKLVPVMTVTVGGAGDGGVGGGGGGKTGAAMSITMGGGVWRGHGCVGVVVGCIVSSVVFGVL